jgi:FtsH-binding integral membrane protein
MDTDNDISEPFIHFKEDEQNEEIEREIAQKIREGFIIKVFGIMTYQVILTSLVICLGFLSSTFKEYLRDSSIIYIICVIIFFSFLLAPIFYPKIYQTVPINYISLTIFTLSFSWVIASTVCMYSSSHVMTVLFLTFVMIVTLTIYAFKADKDLTTAGGVLIVCLVLLIFSTILAIFSSISILYVLLDFISIILLSTYLIYDIQLIIGEKRMKFSEDDYILAAVQIYLDVINLFVKVFQLFGHKE